MSLVLDCHTMVLPALWPLAASCAVTLHVAVLTLPPCGGQPAQEDPESARVMPHAYVVTDPDPDLTLTLTLTLT